MAIHIVLYGYRLPINFSLVFYFNDISDALILKSHINVVRTHLKFNFPPELSSWKIPMLVSTLSSLVLIICKVLISETVALLCFEPGPHVFVRFC